MGKWMVTCKRADFDSIARKYGITPMLARIIRNRDVVEEDAIRKFLEGTDKDLYNPFLLKDMGKAVYIMLQKIREGRKIRIIGDYDIDGVCSTYILYRGLTSCGGDIDTAIPHRIKDGYGLNESLIDDAYKDGIDTIITCDNGIAAMQQIAYANSLGMTVVITDHHEVPYEDKEQGREYILPPALAIVDPKQEDCEYPFSGICGAMVAFKFVLACKKISAMMSGKQETDAMQCAIEQMEANAKNELDCTSFLAILRSDLCLELTEIAAFATIGDVMDLLDENRIIVQLGLRYMGHTRNLGLKALMAATGVEPQKIKQHTVGFILGPCMNATGRLDTARHALELLMSEDYSAAARIAGDLKSLNDSRKDMTLEGVDRAVELIENSELSHDKVLVVYLPDIHESLAGIIAGRIRERYERPTFVLTKGEEGVKGSGRSIDSYHMYEEMTKCKDLFTKYGGHKLAAGLSLPEENVELFRTRLNELCTLTEADFDPVVKLDMEMPMFYATKDFTKELDKLEPFGVGNPKPLFAQKNVIFLKGRKLGKNANVGKYEVCDTNGVHYEAIYFGDLEAFDAYIDDKYGFGTAKRLYNGTAGTDIKLHVAYYPDINEFRGIESLQMVMKYYQ